MSANTPPAVCSFDDNGSRTFTIGPYRLVERLGMGGMGVVYLAEHLDTGERLAVKTALNNRQVAVSALRREVQILDALDHPGVVQLLDKGTSQGVPWFAMELLDGPTLLDTLGEDDANYDSHLELGAPATNMIPPIDPSYLLDGPAAPARSQLRRRSRAQQLGGRFDLDAKRSVLVLLAKICRTLSYLHNQGVVHRDLKPSNVFLRSPKLPVLVDFGVVGWFDGAYSRDRLAGIDRQRFAGTLQYMAPEQLRGDLVDARADLYALGCILYVSVTGRHPFSAPTPQEIVRRHLDGAYVPPDELVADAPRELTRLIRRLLAPDPRDRVGHADIVARALENLTGTEPATLAESSSSARSNHLSRPRFVGRERLLEQVLDTIRTTGPANLILIGGLSGSGKTRFAMELATVAERTGYFVSTESAEAGGHEAVEGVHAEPLSAFRATLQTVADRCREFGAAETGRLVGRRAGVLAQYEPLLAGLPGDAGLDAPIELPPRAARMRAFAFLTETLAAFAEDEPLLIILDDLHLADEMSLEFLASTLRNGGLANVTIVATYRLESAEQLQDLLGMGGLLEMDGLHHFELEPLTAQDITSLIKGMLAVDRVIQPLADRLVSVSAGNPFVVSEYLHAAVEEGLMSRRDDGSWEIDDQVTENSNASDVLSMSRRVSQLLEGRLERLDASDRDLVDVAAVIGRRFERALLVRVSNLSADKLDLALERLVERRILTESDGIYRLIEQVRSVAYAQVGPQKRRQLHQKVARALEHQHGDRQGDRIEPRQLVEHWRGAGMPSRELCYIEHAARDALVRGASIEARSLLRRGLRLLDQLSPPPDGAPKLRRARIERLLAKVHWSRGNIRKTISLLERSLANLGYPVPETTSKWATKALEQSARQLKHLIWPPHGPSDHPTDPHLLDEYLESSSALLWAWLVSGQVNKVVVMATRLANINDSLGAGNGLAMPYALLGALCRRLGLGAVAKFYETRGWENFGEERSAMDFVGATQIFAYSNIARGEWDETERMLRRARNVSERAGDLLNLENLLISQAIFEVYLDRSDRVEELLSKAEDPDTPVRSDRVHAWSHVIRAMLARQRGDFERGAELLDAASEQISGLTTGRGFGLAARAAVEFGRGGHSLGFRAGLQALDFFEELSGGSDTNLMHYPIYQYLCDVFVGCWSSDKLTAYERERALSKARYLTGRFAHLASHVPAATSALLRNRGLLAAIDGDLTHGSALLSESLASARDFGLPFEDRLTRRAAAMFASLPTL